MPVAYQLFCSDFNASVLLKEKELMVNADVLDRRNCCCFVHFVFLWMVTASTYKTTQVRGVGSQFCLVGMKLIEETFINACYDY